MSQHKFKLGQTVQYVTNKLQAETSSGGFKVTRLLPSSGHDQQYRIKNASEPYERVAQESQLVQA